MKASSGRSSIDTACTALIDDFRSRPTLRAGSLITTVFGDSIAPRGGSVWLGSLIAALEPLGINERLVRTSVFRLVKDGWLCAEQRGRRSFYELTADGRSRFRAATQRIYGEPSTHWDGYWSLVILQQLNAVTRDLVKRECGWLGFGALTTNVLAHPAPDRDMLEATLTRLGVAADVIVFTGHTVQSDEPMRQLALDAWKLADLNRGYAEFVDRFDPAARALRRNASVSPETAFRIRTLLIQAYRRLLLRDPQMPAELLPGDWHGVAAYALCRDLYRRLYRQCDVYLSKTLSTADGPLPPPGDDYLQRFGGLGDGE